MASDQADDDPYLREDARRAKALQASLQYLIDNLEDSESARNNVLASNQVAWELGAFKDGRKIDAAISRETLDGLIVRARNDALESKLNSASSLDRLSRIEKKVYRNEIILSCGLGLILGLLLRISF